MAYLSQNTPLLCGAYALHIGPARSARLKAAPAKAECRRVESRRCARVLRYFFFAGAFFAGAFLLAMGFLAANAFDGAAIFFITGFFASAFFVAAISSSLCVVND